MTRTLCEVAGAVGLLGFAAPDAVTAIIGHEPVGGGELAPDNIVHLLLGAVFLGVGPASPRPAASRA